MIHLTLGDIARHLSGRIARRAVKSHFAEAAVAVVLAPGAPQGWDLLLIRRAERRDDPWSGQMALPGGRRDPADADLLATAIRESREETGVTLGSGALLGELDDVEPSTPHLPDIVIRPFVFGLASTPELQPSDEVASCVWVSLADLPGLATEADIVVRGAPRHVKGYKVGDALVWGLTERILTLFLALIR